MKCPSGGRVGHKKDINKEPNRQNALSKHSLQHDHIFDFANTKILANKSNYRKRLVLEMYHITGTLRDFSFEKLINAEPKFSILCFKIGKRGYLYQKLI